MRLRRIESGHYETADGTFAICLSTTGTHWFVAAVESPGARPVEAGDARPADSKAEAAATLARLLADSFSSE